MGVMKCPNCGGVVGDTSPACVDCGQSLGKVETCEECKAPIPRTSKVCPRCSPKILQYMGIKAPPKKKKEEPKRPERPKPPLLNAPRPPTPKPRPNTDDVLEGEQTELRKEPYTPPPKQKRQERIQPPPVMFDRTGPDAMSERKASERRVHWGAVLLGCLVAGIGAAGAFYYLPQIGLDPRLAAKLPEPIRANLLYIAYGAIGLGFFEIIRGFIHRPRALRKCGHCRTTVAAFRRPLSFVCEICGKSTGFRFFNALFVLALLAVVLSTAAAAVMLKTGAGLP